MFPDLADDTYATIGLTGPASTSGIAGAADPSIVEDAVQPVTPYFLTPGATSLAATTLTGASWYVLNTAANGLPDANLQVLIMQVTTTGSISGQINFQVFPLGVGADQEQVSIEFNGTGTFSGGNVTPVEGCTDPDACNYDMDANTDDGSCLMFDDVCGGEGPGATATATATCWTNAAFVVAMAAHAQVAQALWLQLRCLPRSMTPLRHWTVLATPLMEPDLSMPTTTTETAFATMSTAVTVRPTNAGYATALAQFMTVVATSSPRVIAIATATSWMLWSLWWRLRCRCRR